MNAVKRMAIERFFKLHLFILSKKYIHDIENIANNEIRYIFKEYNCTVPVNMVKKLKHCNL